MTSDLSAFGVGESDVVTALAAKQKDFLEKYGFTTATMVDYGLVLRPFGTGDGSLHGGWHPRYAGLLQGYDYADIVFHDLDGTPLYWHAPRVGEVIPYRRARLLGFQGGRGKYRSYNDSGVRLYLPFDQSRPDYWLDLAADVGRTLIITEGEFDAIAGHMHGMPVLGILGVHCFMEKNGRTVAEPGNKFLWSGRLVQLCFDMDLECTDDAPYKPGVQRGLELLTMQLSLLGARVQWLHLWKTTVGRQHRGEKVGLSEYFKLGGTVTELYGTAEDCVGVFGPKVLEVYRRYAMCKGDILDLDTGELISTGKWSNLVSNISLRIEDKTVPVYVQWMRDPRRHEVTEFVFNPEESYGLIPGTTQFNLWKGFACLPGSIEDPLCMEGVEIFEKLGEAMWGDMWPWVRGCLAHLIQKPTEGRHHVLILQSPVGGIGKSAFFKIIMCLLGRGLAIALTPERFFAQFNQQASGKLLVLFDEAHIVSRRTAALLKDQSASGDLVIEGKGVNSVTVPWRGIFCLATNEEFAIPVLTATERRYAQATPIIGFAEKREWQSWLHGALVRLGIGRSGFGDDSGLTGEEAEAAAKRRSGIMGWLMLEEWLDDYQPFEDAPVTESIMESAEASLSERDAIALQLYQDLPTNFVLAGNLMGCNGELIDKYLLDKVKYFAKVHAVTTWYSLKLGGRMCRVFVVSKDRNTLVLGKDSQGHSVLKAVKGEEVLTRWVRNCMDKTVDFMTKWNPYDVSRIREALDEAVKLEEMALKSSA